ncbi:MAG: ABC transporter permease [Anaerolineales bacterium]|nr:ABC transporter permease [Anaerolineales bacterium]
MIKIIGQWRFERQIEPSPWAGILSRAIAVLLALIIAMVSIELAGMPALELLKQAVKGTLGSVYGIGQAAVLATPLIMTGLSVALGMKMKIWNIGAEGQFFMGACAATAVGIYIDGPPLLVFILIFLAAGLAGAAWMAFPAIVRAWLNVSEVITTLLLNFVAIQMVNYFAIGPWRDKTVAMASASYWIPFELPMISGSRVHVGFFLAIFMAIGLAIVLGKTKWGFEIGIIGNNRQAGEYAGMPVKGLMVGGMMLAGAIAGIAGATELTGVAHRLSGWISNEYGYLGIMVAAIAGASPYAIIPVGFFLAILLNSGIILQSQGLSINAVLAITGCILLFSSIGEALNRYRLVKVIDKSDSNDFELECVGRGAADAGIKIVH